MLYGEVVSVPSTFALPLKVSFVTTPFVADAVSVGLVPMLYVVLLDGAVSLTVTEEVGVGVGVGVGIGVGVGVGVGTGVGVGVGVGVDVGVGVGVREVPVPPFSRQTKYLPAAR